MSKLSLRTLYNIYEQGAEFMYPSKDLDERERLCLQYVVTLGRKQA